MTTTRPPEAHMPTQPLHPDFPPTPVEKSWDTPAPFDDIYYAFDAQWGSGEKFSFEQIESIESYYLDSNDGRWTPETPNNSGSEVTLVLLGRLVDGRWFGLEAWNDYTGWGCQDGCDIYAGASRGDVIRNGLTQEGRTSLGVSA